MMSWKMDPQHSQIEFKVRHMMITNVRGRFGSFDGTVEIDEANPQASNITGTVDVTSIDTADKDRDGHLRSADFFDVENYPKMRFRGTRIEALGDDRYKLYGDLTIKDVTNEVVFDATDRGRMKDPWGGQRRALSATGKLSRKDFGLTWNVALEAGGWLVGDEVTISAELQLIEE
jgi:polyisoprenoid-binding protein YceI